MRTSPQPAKLVTTMPARDPQQAPISSIDPEKDGIEHINIDRFAKTELGKTLTHMQKFPFEHPQFGPFQSVEGYIGWLRTGGSKDSFRYIYGMFARHRAREVQVGYIPNFQELVMEANYLKITQNADLLLLFKESTLPFEHYYLHQGSGLPIRGRNAIWLIPAFMHLRDMIKQGQPFPEVDYSAITALRAQFEQSEQSKSQD